MTTGAASDEALMKAYQKGDVSAFAALMDRYERPLWGFLRRFVRDATTAEDLLQEVFMRVVQSAPSWEPAAKVSTWLYTIARNLCTDHARRMQHRKTVSLDGAVNSGGRSDEDSAPRRIDRVAGGPASGERTSLNRELAEHLEEAIGELPDDQREVFLMREVMDLSFAEIAEAVGASEPTVKSRMRYALERLRRALEEFRDPDAVSGVAQRT